MPMKKAEAAARKSMLLSNTTQTLPAWKRVCMAVTK